MSDEILVKMSQEIGELVGAMREFTKAQELTNEKLTETIDKHHHRIGSLEDAKSMIIGGSAVLGFISGFISDIVGKFWEH